jgi:hypothetical protein
MSIADEVKSAIEEFEKDNPTLKGKAYLTSGDRSVEEQIDIILDPKREDNYLNIKERFKSQYKLSALPLRRDLTAAQVAWWEAEVKKQAGKSPGFPHVGDFAVLCSNRHHTNIAVKSQTVLLCLYWIVQ